MSHELILWIVFGIVVIVMMALDLGIFVRKPHILSIREAFIWSGIWVLVALAFNLGVYIELGHVKGLEFFTGYLIERFLSMDNIFVFVLIFVHFRVPAEYQRKVLIWGILAALILRGVTILAGVSLVHAFNWILYVFGGFLVLTGIKMLFKKADDESKRDQKLFAFLGRILPISNQFNGDKFFARIDGKRFATPLLIVLLIVEITDLIFAVDSIPAIFGITSDPFIIYTSNILAILGLRAMYFVLAGIMPMFTYLTPALSVILTFIGVKMLLADIIKIPIGIALAFIVVVLIVAIIASILFRPKDQITPPNADTKSETPSE